MADANGPRDWRIYADFAQRLIRIARPLNVDDEFGVDLANTVYALDATTIELRLSIFPGARYTRTLGAVKLHTLLDLRGPIPALIHISDGKMNDVRALDLLVPEPGSFSVMDRGYHDFQRLGFFGTTENAVQTQIWIAVCVYVLVAIVKKRLDIDASLYTFLQALDVTLFERMPIDQLLSNSPNEAQSDQNAKQLSLFGKTPGH